MKSTENKPSLIFDLFFCIIFMPILVVIGPMGKWLFQWPLFFVLSTLFLYGCFFAVSKINVPQLLIEKKYRRIGLWLAGLAAMNYSLSLYPLPDMDFVTPAMSRYQTEVRNFSVGLTLWLMFSLVMGYGLTTSLVKELYRQLLLHRKLENERNKAELAVFKAQISPHFLFNTLNSLYSLVIGTSQKAEEAFIKFTEILRYTYVTINHETVALDDEIEYIGNYIDLQAIRLNHHTHIRWTHSVDRSGIMIPPMLLLTFVENAFKYGASTSNDCNVDISLDVSNGTLTFETRNSIMKHADDFRSNVPVGVENCRARLAGIYPGRHSLTATESDGEFHLLLKINLN